MDSVDAKLARAKKHLKALEDAIDAYLAPPEPYLIRGEEYMERHSYAQRVFIEVVEFPPDEKWGPLIGDFVHNLRSALDHLAWEIARPKFKAESRKEIGFPVAGPYRDQGTRDRLNADLKMFPKRTRAAIKRLQPYTTGNSQDPLWVLHQLWNMDKHRTIHTAGFTVIHPSGGRNWGTFEGGTQPLAYRAGPTLQGSLKKYVEMWANSVKDVAFGYPEEFGLAGADYSFAGLPIRGFLTRIQEVVVAGIDDIRATL